MSLYTKKNITDRQLKTGQRPRMQEGSSIVRRNKPATRGLRDLDPSVVDPSLDRFLGFERSIYEISPRVGNTQSSFKDENEIIKKQLASLSEEPPTSLMPKTRKDAGLTKTVGFDEGMIQHALGALADVESRASGGYSAIGEEVTSGMYKGDRAYGKYQVMGANVPVWTKEHYGTALTPEEFLKNKEAQETVAENEIMSSFDKYGSIEDAISVWFTGSTLKKAQDRKAADQNINIDEYLRRWRKSYNNRVKNEVIE